jgi:hypothetical protein
MLTTKSLQPLSTYFHQPHSLAFQQTLATETHTQLPQFDKMAQRFSLLDLPAEIHRQTFGYILVIPRDKVIRDSHTKSACDGCDFANAYWQAGLPRPKDLCHQGPVPTDLLKVCKDLNKIATAILFCHNKFSFISVPSFNKFVRQISNLARQNLRNVIIEFATNSSFQIRNLHNLVLSTPLSLFLDTIELRIPDRCSTPASAQFADSIWRFMQLCLADRHTRSENNGEIAEATMKHFRLQLEELYRGERFFNGKKVLGSDKHGISVLRLMRSVSAWGEEWRNRIAMGGWLIGFNVAVKGGSALGKGGKSS